MSLSYELMHEVSIYIMWTFFFYFLQFKSYFDKGNMEEQIQSIRDLDAEEVDLSTKSTSYTQNIKDLDAEEINISPKSRSYTDFIFFLNLFFFILCIIIYITALVLLFKL